MTKIECVKGWEQQLTPGILYCMLQTVHASDEHEVDYEAVGALVYWTGRELCHEDGDPARDDWDYLVPQSTTPNREFIETGFWQ